MCMKQDCTHLKFKNKTQKFLIIFSLSWLFSFLQPVTDAYRQPQDTDDKSQVELCETGGIDIDKAKSRLLKEDLFDKKLYREKVQLKHRVSYAHMLSFECFF